MLYIFIKLKVARCWLSITNSIFSFFFEKKTDFGGIILAVLVVQINNAKYYLHVFFTDINNLAHHRIDTAFYRICLIKMSSVSRLKYSPVPKAKITIMPYDCTTIVTKLTIFFSPTCISYRIFPVLLYLTL